MGRAPRVSFQFEKNGLLFRGKNAELWDGWIDGRAHLVKRFRKPRASHWNEFALLSRIKHPSLLKASYAGFLRDGSFCYGMPLDFVPERKPVSKLPEFVATFLSLVHSLEQKKIRILWNPEHLIWDRKAERTYLAGVHPLRPNQEQDPVHHLTLLCNVASQHLGANHELTRILRKWSRRKEEQVTGCLEDLYRSFFPGLDRTTSVYEWLYSRELELAGGLFRLAEQGKGRALIVRADTGEGKSTLIRQIYCDLLSRRCNTIYFAPEKEERTFHSLKSLLRLLHQIGRSTMPMPQDPNEEIILSYLEKIFANSRVVSSILIDNFHNCDLFSQRLLQRVFQNLKNWKVLFVLTSDSSWAESSDYAVTVSLHKPVFRQMEEAVLVPLWQEKQRKTYFQTIYERTSGNPLFFYEYLTEALRARQDEMYWNGNEWNFAQSSVPDFPMALLEFSWNNRPELTAPELALLETASLKGDTFRVSEQDCSVAQSLLQKQVLTQSDGRFRFRKPLLAEAIRKRLDPDRFKLIHKTLAEELSARVEADSMLLLARHFLNAGEPSSALHWTCRSLQELGYSVEPPALLLLNQLENHQGQLNVAENMQLFQQQGEIYRRRGKFQHAAVSYRRAMEFADDSFTRIRLGLWLIECHILQEDIVSAQHALNSLNTLVSTVKDDALLFRYSIAHGICSHYRGPRNAEDFQKAFSHAEALADDALLAHGYRRCAWLSLREGQLAEASRLARKALRFAKLARDTEEMGHCFKIFASVAWRKSRLDHAEKMMKKSIRAFQKIQNEFGSAGVWTLLGNVYIEKYRFSDAVRAFEKAVGLFGGLDHSREVSLAQFNMGLVYLELGKLKQAEKIFLRCRAIDKESGNKWFYAYDLRALAVYCILQGYPRKATRLLKRTIEICEELQAEGDILQTTMILLFHYLDQANYREAQPLVAYLEQRTGQSTEPLTQAEIHHLLAYYYGYLNETEKARGHLTKSLAMARRIHHFKLIGKNLILALIFRRSAPRQSDRDFLKAVSNFKKSKNQLEFADYLLKLYQAYPSLAKEKPHLKRIRWMESFYHALHIKPRYLATRRLIPSRSTAASRDLSLGWWQSLLGLLSSKQDLQSKLSSVLNELSKELGSSYGQLRYLGASGTFDSVRWSDPLVTNTVEELSLKIFEQAIRRKESVCLDARLEPELAAHPWTIVNEVGSVIAVPVCKEEGLMALWYFERTKDAPNFSDSDLQKLSFFSTACVPLLEKAIEQSTGEQSGAPAPRNRFENVIGSSRAIVEVSRQVEKVAPVDVSVLIVGESGTGKELIARNIHRMSKRAAGPFVALNCSAIPETLIESELFGHARGAFTGAVAARPGSIEQANKGTLFLDEIGDLSAAAQAKLLRVIQEREVQRVGETSVRKVDVRFLFATHKNLEKMVKDGAYREDLFYRIAGYTLTVPPLRERAEDIHVLLRHFTDKFSREFEKDGIRFSASALKVLADYPWPGNIREMENLIQSLLVNADPGTTIEIDALPRALRTHHVHTQANGLSLEEGRELFEREFVRQALVRNDWNKTRTARELKITRQGLINMMQRLHLQNG